MKNIQPIEIIILLFVLGAIFLGISCGIFWIFTKFNNFIKKD